MRYIRTKDNRIIDTAKYYLENSNLFKNGAYQEYKKELANAYSQADTIEELVDTFVYKYVNPYHKEAMPTYEITDMSLKSMKLTMEMTSGATFYGAIWTDKGLIYVAKMNEKGELELL